MQIQGGSRQEHHSTKAWALGVQGDGPGTESSTAASLEHTLRLGMAGTRDRPPGASTHRRCIGVIGRAISNSKTPQREQPPPRAARGRDGEGTDRIEPWRLPGTAPEPCSGP